MTDPLAGCAAADQAAVLEASTERSRLLIEQRTQELDDLLSLDFKAGAVTRSLVDSTIHGSRGTWPSRRFSPSNKHRQLQQIEENTMTHEVAVIIGSGSIGVAIGRVAGIGRRVLLADYNEETMNAVAGQLRGEGYDVTTHQVDISDRDAVAALADTAASAGDVTRVVIAAGVSPVQATTERVLHVDLLGTSYVLEEFGRVIAPAGSGVVISSMAGHMGEGYPREREHALAYTPTAELLSLPFLAANTVGDSGAAYTLAKRGNALRVQAAATTWGARGARINSLSPGIISTPLAQDEMSGPYAEGYRNMIRTSAAGRMGTPAEVAAVAGFLLGPEGAFITGSDLLIDGGVIAAMRAGQL